MKKRFKKLKKDLKRPVLLAYLYMRMADTIEDSPSLPAKEKVSLLKKFSQAVNRGGKSIDEFVCSLPQNWKNSENAECALCYNAAVVIPLLSEFSKPIAKAVKKCVEEMCSGMAEFSERQEMRTDGWFFIESEAELDRYCYFVAGIVGNMLTELFCLSKKNRRKSAKKTARACGFFWACLAACEYNKRRARRLSKKSLFCAHGILPKAWHKFRARIFFSQNSARK